MGLLSCSQALSEHLFVQRPQVVNTAGLSCAQSDHAERYTGHAMGTAITFLAWTSDAAAAQAAFRQALQEIDRLERLMTTWSHPGWAPSEIMQLNAQAGGAALPVSADTFAVLESAVCMAQKSDGLFDVTIGAFEGLWHFDENLKAEVPDDAAIAQRLKAVDYHALQLDRAHQTARLKRPGMALNLGGIAKGYAVDRAIAVLHACGIHNVVVQAGGDLYASGQRGAKPWRIGIRDPRGLLVDDKLAYVAVQNQAVSTAGDYERGFELEGRRYHHILDPRTGRPSALSQSVTIVAPSAWLADAIDDVVFLQGPELGLRWIKQFAGVEAVVVDNAGRMFVSDGLKQAIIVADGPNAQAKAAPAQP
jgi:thiamine biosynthesis lipoprotein